MDNNDLAVGDIVFAKRYKTKMEKDKIKVGHRTSPYVVIKKENDGIYALQCTSNPHQEIDWKILYYPLNRYQYHINKNSYVNCRSVELLSDVQIIEKLGKLNYKDLNNLKKYLYILKYSEFPLKPNIEDCYLDFQIGIGDIVLFEGKKYYIYDATDTEFLTYPVRGKIKEDKSILINNTFYSFAFECTKKMDKKLDFTLVDTFHSGEQRLILQFKNSYLAKLKMDSHKKEVVIGSLIEYHDQLYYVYQKDDIYYFCYVVYNNLLSKAKMAGLKINGGIYYTFFNTNELPITKLNEVGYVIKREATEKEVKYNQLIAHIPKEERKNKRKELRNVDITRNISDFIPSVILKNVNTQKYYLIIARKDDVVELVNINDFSDCMYFLLEEENCPFGYYRIATQEEYEFYLHKVHEFKKMVALFD